MSRVDEQIEELRRLLSGQRQLKKHTTSLMPLWTFVLCCDIAMIGFSYGISHKPTPAPSAASAPVVHRQPILGTPTTSGTLTNATGLPISTGVSGLGTGVATFLGTPSSAQLAISSETGTGALVFGTSPILVTPTFGTWSYDANEMTAKTSAGLSDKPSAEKE